MKPKRRDPKTFLKDPVDWILLAAILGCLIGAYRNQPPT